MVFKDPIPIANQPGWPGLAFAIAEAADGNATLLSTPLVTSNTDPQFADWAILCNDWTVSSNSYADLLYKQQLANATTPITRGMSQAYSAQTRCIGFPEPVSNPARVEHVKNGKQLPILLVQSTRDPECAPQWAVGVEQQIEKSVLVWRAGDGHTSYNLQGETSRAMDAYLVNMTLPAAGEVYAS
jgi:hypothetical protein